MRKNVLVVICFLPCFLYAQGVWERPQDVKDQKTTTEQSTEAAAVKNPMAKYFEGAVPEVDGKVVWTYEFDVPGQSAQQLYDHLTEYLSQITKAEGQLEGSGIALVNKQERKIVASMREWLTFSSTFFALDRSRMNYTLIATCSDGHVSLEMSRITYVYDLQDKRLMYKAEEWISDRYSMNKKKTKLYKQSGKFRKKTIDRKNELFENIRKSFYESNITDEQAK